jgi:hypothetical protein
MRSSGEWHGSEDGNGSEMEGWDRVAVDSNDGENGNAQHRRLGCGGSGDSDVDLDMLVAVWF